MPRRRVPAPSARDFEQAPTPARRATPAAEAADAESLYGDELGPGAQVGNYVVEALRSRGGFATIYQARHLSLRRLAALKVLHRQLVTSRTILERFHHEAQTANLIRHPHIVDIYELGQLDDGRPYFVMEWLPGRNLEEELAARGRFSPAEALAVLEDVGDALCAAHRVGVVHRDVKAGNIIAVPAGDWFLLKLVDFGIAKLLDTASGQASISSSGARLGTPWNMSPEQILGQRIDARTDIYALGVLLHQMLTGQLPFRAASASEVEELHLNAKPPAVSASVPVSPDLDGVVARCLEKQPANRYPSVAALLAALRRAAA